MRLLVAISALVLGVSAHAQQGAPKPPDTEQPLIEKSSERDEASLGATGVNAPAPRTGMPPRPGDDLPPRPGDYAKPDTRDTQPGQDEKAEENATKEKPRAETKEDREASTGATSPRY